MMSRRFFLILGMMLLAFASLKAQTNGKTYLRPSLTNIYINRGERLSVPVIEQMVANGISAKFNDNSVSRNAIPLSKNEAVSEKKLTNLLQSQISREIAKIWFPFDSKNNEYSRKVMFDRGLDAATYQDVQTAGAAFRQKDLLRDAGKLLISRSYIVVYDVFNIRQERERKAKIYIADCDVYLYKLDWAEAHYAALFTEPNNTNPNYINQLDFPVIHITKEALRNIKVSEPDEWSDNEVLSHFAQEIVKQAELKLSQVNEDFQVQRSIYSTSPIRARIGFKEGLATDQRYFVYEQVQTASGEIKWKRRGTVRANKVAKNQKDNALTSRFYQISGGKLMAGMNLVQAPDAGIGISIYGSSIDVNALLELSIGMWGSRNGLGKSNFAYGTKVFVKYSMPLHKMTSDIVHIDGKIEKVRSIGILGGGISKDLCFARCLALTPYAGFTFLLAFEPLQPALKLTNRMRFGGEGGCNFTIALSPNLLLFGNANFNSVAYLWYSQKYSVGGGLKIQF